MEGVGTWVVLYPFRDLDKISYHYHAHHFAYSDQQLLFFLFQLLCPVLVFLGTFFRTRLFLNIKSIFLFFSVSKQQTYAIFLLQRCLLTSKCVFFYHVLWRTINLVRQISDISKKSVQATIYCHYD
jgi:hypothetical protein